MTDTELRAALKSPPIPWLILGGEEGYLVRHYLGEIRKKLAPDEALAAFNHLRFEGEEIDFSRLEEAITAPPMMADYKLIEWHLADFERMKAKDVERFIALCALKSDYPNVTVLFPIEEGKLIPPQKGKKPSRRYAEIAEGIDCVFFPRSEDSRLLGWISRHFAEEKVAYTPELGRELIARCGHSMDILAGEIDKLTSFAHATGKETLTVEEVRHVTCATYEADAFGLTNAILAGNAAAAYENLRDMKNRRVDPTLIFGSVFRLFCDLLAVARLREEGLNPAAIRTATGLHEYKVTLYLRALGNRNAARLERTLQKCRELDLAAKMGAVNYSGLERLIAEELG